MQLPLLFCKDCSLSFKIPLLFKKKTPLKRIKGVFIVN